MAKYKLKGITSDEYFLILFYITPARTFCNEVIRTKTCFNLINEDFIYPLTNKYSFCILKSYVQHDHAIYSFSIEPK